MQLSSRCAGCRDEIASCSERAFIQLSVREALKLLLFSSAKEALNFEDEVCQSVRANKAVNVLQRGWQVKGDTVYFDQQAQEDLKDVPALELMNHTLTYARELERIV